MVVNGARIGKNLGSEDELVTEQALIKKVDHPIWNKLLDPNSTGFHVVLDDLKPLIQKGLEAYGIYNAEIEIVHTPDLSKETQNRLHRALVENEKSSRNFIIANFIQGVYTDDAFVGHLAPVGSYDAKERRVLIMDPDRKWYEPYWISEEIFLRGMVTKDKHSGNEWRGYLWVKLKN